MAGTIRAHGNTGMRGNYFNIKIIVANSVPNLIPGPACGKHSESRDKYNLAATSQARRSSHHILLSHTKVKKSMGEFPGKQTCARRTGQIRIQNYDIFVFPA
jgi:hypothetical protein